MSTLTLDRPTTRTDCDLDAPHGDDLPATIEADDAAFALAVEQHAWSLRPVHVCVPDQHGVRHHRTVGWVVFAGPHASWGIVAADSPGVLTRLDDGAWWSSHREHVTREEAAALLGCHVHDVWTSSPVDHADAVHVYQG